jgi:predicted P-loop ATPase
LKVAFYDSAQDAVPRSEEVEWPDLVARLVTHERRATKNGPAWSPVDIVERRKNENVRAITAAVFDLDHVSGDSDALDQLDARGLAYVAHSTYSHGFPDNISLRLVLKLNRPCLPTEWVQVRRATMETLHLPADPATRDLARIYYLPSAPEGADVFAASREGAALDVDALLRRPAAPAASIPSPQAWPPETQQPIDAHDLAAQLRAHARAENKSLVARALRGEPLSPPRSGPYGGQDNELQALMSTIAFVLPNDTPDDLVTHLLRPCFAVTEWGEGIDHLIAVALDKLHRARERKSERDAKRLAENKAIRDRLGLREAATAPAPTPLDEGDAEDPDAWAQRLITAESKKGTLWLKNIEANITLVLQNSPEWKGRLRFNEVSKRLELTDPPAGVSTKPDGLDIGIAIWFQRSDYGAIGLSATPKMTENALREIVRTQAYDPLHDYLDGLVWDRVPRVDTLLERYFGATDDDPAYLRAISRRWLISAVCRGLKPGEKVDTVLILEGAQGIYKSTSIKALSAPWFCESKIDIANKDTWALAAQYWMIELAENEAMSRAQRDQLKAFFARSEDTFRPPYGKTNAPFPRRALFVSTTNPREYLQIDPSGYRRYWPVFCTKIDLEALRRDRDQLFAEAVAMLRAGEQWWLTDEEAELAKVATKKREEVVGESWQEKIREWFSLRAPEKRLKKITMHQVLTSVLGFETSQITQAKELEIGKVLHSMGFEKCIQTLGGVRSRAWVAPAELLNAPQLLAASPATPAKTG